MDSVDVDVVEHEEEQEERYLSIALADFDSTEDPSQLSFLGSIRFALSGSIELYSSMLGSCLC
jgi:hypothetical protein